MFAKVAVLLLLAQQVHGGAHGTPGTAGCACIDPVRLAAVAVSNNKVSFASPSTSVTTVPKTYGTGCKAWDGEANMQYSSSCTKASPAAWCAKKWCYIDMCNCNKTDLGASSYFTILTSSNLKLGYSYDTCDSSAASSSNYLTDYCGTKNQADCGTDASCTYSSSKCNPATKTQMLKNLKCAGTTGCQCIAPPAMGCVGKCADGMVPLQNPTHTVKMVPSQYGAGCSAWDMAPSMEFYKDCAPNQANPPSWCMKAWCYIDMCQCNKADIASSTYFNVSAQLKLGYSYETCGGTTTHTGNYLTTHCKGKQTADCDSAAVCKTAGGACVAKTTAEIKSGMNCPSSKVSACSPTPAVPAVCPSTTQEASMCSFLGMGALWALASLFLASRF